MGMKMAQKAKIPNIIGDMMGKVKVERTKTEGANTKEKFDDYEASASKKIVGVTVRCGAIVDAVGLIYEDGDGKLYGNKSGGASHRIMFDGGDSLKSVSGVWGANYYGKALSKLVLTTKKGKTYGPFGYSNGQQFQIEIPDDGIFMGFTGTASTTERHGFVESIGIIYATADADAADGLGGLAGGLQDGLKNLL